MNRSMKRKILGDIWTRKSRTALVAIAIFIGVLGVVTLITAGDLLVRQLREDIRSDELPMLQAFTYIPGDLPAEINDLAYIESLSQFPGVTRIEGHAAYPFFWKFPDQGRFRQAYVLAFLDPMDQIQLEPFRMLKGSFPVAGQNQVGVELRMAEDFDLEVGDQVDLRILSERDENNTIPTETWTVSGIVFHPYNDTPEQSMYLTWEDLQRVTNFRGMNTLDVRFVDFATTEASRTAFETAISEQTPYTVPFSFVEDPAVNRRLEGTRQYAQVMAILAVVAMVVSGFLVINVINNLVVEQRRQIGVMKSLGATRYETFAMYGGIAVVYGVLGMVPGVLLGIPAGYKMAVLVGDFANTVIDHFSVSPLAIILGIMLGLGVPILSAVIPVYNGTRVTILEAMTDLGIGGGYRVGPLTRLVKVLPLPLNIKQSLNNITQRKWRLALTVLTLTLAISAFMGVSAVFVRLDQILKDLFSTFDYEVMLETTDIQRYETVKSLILENVDEVKDVHPGTGAMVELEGYVSPYDNSSSFFLIGIEPSTSLLNMEMQEGSGWQDDPERHGIVLTNQTSNQLKKSIGDTVSITYGGKRLELEIIGIMNYPFDMGFMPWRDLAYFAGYTSGAPRPNEYFIQAEVEGYTGSAPDGQVTAWGIDASVVPYLPRSAGEALIPGQPGVMISAAMATNGDYQPGDMLTFIVGDRTESAPITGVFSIPAEFAEQVQQEIPDDIVAFYWEDLARLNGLTLEGEAVPNVFFVVMRDPGLNARQIDDIVEDINDVLEEEGITFTFYNMVDLEDQASRAILSVGLILNMASLVMAAVGAIGLLTTLSISVFERQKEIGVMRSVGAVSRVIIVQFLVEGVLVGLIAWIIAIPLSYGLSYGLTEMLPFGEFIEFAYPIIMIPAGLLGIVIIAALSSIWPSVAASRKTVSNILRYQ